MARKISQHTEWLSLIEVSGPFLVFPVRRAAAFAPRTCSLPEPRPRPTANARLLSSTIFKK